MIKFIKKKEPSVEQDINWPNHVVSLDESTFYDFIKTYPLTVIDFWAPWCNPCKTMLSRLRRLQRVYKGSVAFGRVNTQREKRIAKKYNIMSIPQFSFFHFGKNIGNATGVKSVGELKDSIDGYRSKYL